MNRNQLSANQLRSLKYTGIRQKLWDGDGLLLRVLQSGFHWQVRYTYKHRDSWLKVGEYPDMSLSEARQQRDEIKRKARAGIDPKPEPEESPITFALAAERWKEKDGREWSVGHQKNVRLRLKKHVLPYIGDLPLREVTTRDVKRILDRIVKAGHHVTARKVRQYVSQVCRHAVIEEDIKDDPTAVLEGYVKGGTTRSHPHITESAELGKLLRLLDSYSGSESTAIALRMAPHVMLRPGELRQGRWSEIDLEGALWTIPAERMKKSSNGNHIVPLSCQVVELLRELRPITSRGPLLFPGIRNHQQAISDNTLPKALRQLGVARDKQTIHGFRHTASTLLNETKGYDPDLIEVALHHGDNSMRGKYNGAKYLRQRRVMMQSWSDYLESLKNGADIVELRA